MSDTTWATTLLTSNRLSDIRATLNSNFAAARKLTVVSITSADSPYTLGTDVDVLLCDATSGAITVNLPAIASSAGQCVTAKKTDGSGNAVTLDGNSSETIDGAATVSLSSQYNFRTVVGGASEWHVIGTS